MTKSQHLENNRTVIIDKYNSGTKTPALGREFNCNPGLVHMKLKEWGVAVTKRSDNYGRKDLDDKIISMHAAGYSAYKISKELWLSKQSVLSRSKKLGLDFSHNYKLINPVRLKDCVGQVVELYSQGLNSAAIAKQMGYSQSKIYIMLRDLGYDQSSTYSVDLSFFDCITTEIQAYILGFWYADGNNKRDGIRMQITDLEILERIKTEMRYDGPIRTCPPRAKGRKTQYLLSISRKELSQALTKCGCPPAKSLVLTFPDATIVPTTLRSHFIRGYNDGDGSIGKGGVCILGTKEFLAPIAEIGETFDCICYWRQRFPERKKNNYSLTLGGGREKFVPFLHWLYKDATIYMERKYKKYQELEQITCTPLSMT